MEDAQTRPGSADGAQRPAGEQASGLLPSLDELTSDERAEVERWRSVDARRVERFARAIMVPVIDHGFRLRSFGVEHVPVDGPFLLVPNHSSYMDPFLHARPQPRVMRFMGKQQMFEWPVLKWLIAGGGGFPVRRGQSDGFAMVLARALLEDGQPVVMYAEGTRFRSDDALGPPRSGVARLALASGVPVIPAASWGTKPAAARGEPGFPRLPKVTTVYGPPMSFDGYPTDRAGVEQVRDEIWEQVQRMYDAARAEHGRR